MFEFQPFDKIARLRRELVITEKLDGTNAQVAIFPLDDEVDYADATCDPYCIDIMDSGRSGDSPLAMYAGSRKRWIAPEGTPGLPKGCDNFAFARFVSDNARELFQLGEGRHFGEWYGQGIQRGYGLHEKRFALFNTARWGAHNPNTPACCEVVPTLNYIDGFRSDDPEEVMTYLFANGSVAVPGWPMPEGVVVYHTASRTLYKQTFDLDNGKWNAPS